MNIQPVNYNLNPNFGNKFSKSVMLEDFTSFMKRMDSWTQSQLDKIQIKYPKYTLEKEVAIDALFVRREAVIKQKKQQLAPMQKTFWQKLLVTIGLM